MVYLLASSDYLDVTIYNKQCPHFLLNQIKHNFYWKKMLKHIFPTKNLAYTNKASSKTSILGQKPLVRKYQPYIRGGNEDQK